MHRSLRVCTDVARARTVEGIVVSSRSASGLRAVALPTNCDVAMGVRPTRAATVLITSNGRARRS